MESRVKLAGHPIHPMLIVFPLGLLATAVVFDILSLVLGNPELAIVGWWAIIAGIVGGLVAAVFGLWEWLYIPGRTRAKSIGLWHGLMNVVVVSLFAVAWWMRLPGDHAVTAAPLLLELTAAVIAVVSGWIGGELVDRLGVGIDRGAHLNASNSLSGRPANEPASEEYRKTA